MQAQATAIQEPTTKQELTAKITSMIATTIGVPPSTIGPRDSLIDKFNMESLDMLDISFRVNKEFGLKLYRGDFFQKATVAVGAELVKDGKLTKAGVALLRARLTEARDNPLLQEGAPKTVLARVYCVDSWVRQVTELRAADLTSGEAFLDDWFVKYKQSL